MTSILFAIVRNCCSGFKDNYHKNEKLFLNFFFHFFNLHRILKNLKKNLILIAIAFPKLQTVKEFVRPLPKKRPATTPLKSHFVKEPKTFVKSA